MSQGIVIETGATHAVIQLPPTHPKARYVGDYIRRHLTEHDWDPRLRRVFTIRNFVKYDADTSLLHIPIGFLDDFLKLFIELGLTPIVREQKPYPVRKIKVKMNPKWHDKPHQVEAIQYLSDTSTPRRGLSLQPGAGKTYSSTKALVNIGDVGIIIVAGLVEQWIKSIREQTNAGDEVYLLKEYSSLEMLMGSDWKPSIFVASLATMRLYSQQRGNYADLPLTFPQFFAHYGIGTKIMDEVHRDFHATTMMDLLLNVPNNIYLTATFTQSGREARKIFDKIYPSSMRFGEDRYKKYVTAYMYGFHGQVMERRVVRSRGYSQPRYEHEWISRVTKFKYLMDTVVKPIVNMHFLNVRKPGQKMLIFVQTLEMVEKLKQELKKVFPKLVIKEYVAGSPQSHIGDGVDIIITVPQRGGTGLDIKNLKTAYNMISTKAPTAIEQWLGRLRELKDGESLIYVDQYDINLQSHLRHVAERREILKNKTRDYHEHVLNYL